MKYREIIKAFEIVMIGMLSLCMKAHVNGLDVYVNRNCGSSYNLNTVGNVELYLTEALNSECQITVEKNKEWDSEFPRLCVSPETFSGCQVTVEVHNIMVINGYHDKTFSCINATGAHCAYVDKLIMVFKPTGNYAYLSDIKLKAYRGKSEYDSTIDVSFPGWLIAVMVLSFIFVIGITVVLLVCRVYRQRALMSMANPYRAPQFSPYPTVQYQTTPQPAANVHPAVAGYQPPATGYGVPTSGYPTSQTVASQEQGFHRGYQPSNQISYAAPPNPNLSEPPPSYHQALTMKDKSGT